MWHNYSRGKNVIMTSSMLAFSDNAPTPYTKTCVLGCFLLHLFDVSDQNKQIIYSFWLSDCDKNL